MENQKRMERKKLCRYNELYRNGIATKAIDKEDTKVTITITANDHAFRRFSDGFCEERDLEKIALMLENTAEDLSNERSKLFVLRCLDLIKYALTQHTVLKEFTKLDDGYMYIFAFENDKEATYFIDHLSQAVQHYV